MKTFQKNGKSFLKFSFNEWLEIGKECGWISEASALPSDHRFKQKSVRIYEGHERENELIARMNAASPFVIKKTGVREDKDGVDAVIRKLKSGQSVGPYSLQIKERQTGEDFLIEAVKPFVPEKGEIELTGKDVRSTPYYYVFVVNEKAHFVKGQDVKSVVDRMIAQFASVFRKNNQVTSVMTRDGTVKVVTSENPEDYYLGKPSKKIIAYIRPSSVKTVYGFDI